MKGKYSAHTDDELVLILRKKWTKNKQAAFSEIYNRYGREIYAYVTKIMNNSDDANDMFQEAMLDFYKFAQEKDVTQIKNLLMKIARNKCLNFIRNNKKESDVDVGDVLRNQGYDPDFGKNMDMQEMYCKALDSLPEQQKELIVLKYYFDYKYHEMEEITGLGMETMKQMIFRANKQLREFLKPYYKDYSIHQLEENEQEI
jgi:RNA polymerase sigma-70 factor (ECF subfamily)